jgi:hypothetical protein
MATRIMLWLVGAGAGSLQFWLVQALWGQGTITDFLGRQIVEAGEYAPALAPMIGWGLHLTVSGAYALVVALLVIATNALPAGPAMAASLLVSVLLGWITAVIAPPAISVAISLAAGQGWPAELYPLNAEIGLPFWNHVGFFVLNWLVQALGAPAAQAAE